MPARTPRTKAEKQSAVRQVMHEYKHGKLHSGSKQGPKVKSREQAVAIAMSESGQSKKNYDRSSHFKGNPGFPSSEAGGSPPPATYQAHEKRERDVLGAGYGQHEAVEFGTGRGAFTPPAPKAAHAFRVPGQKRAGVLRMSGHAGAHRIGKR